MDGRFRIWMLPASQRLYIFAAEDIINISFKSFWWLVNDEFFNAPAMLLPPRRATTTKTPLSFWYFYSHYLFILVSLPAHV